MSAFRRSTVVFATVVAVGFGGSLAWADEIFPGVRDPHEGRLPYPRVNDDNIRAENRLDCLAVGEKKGKGNGAVVVACSGDDAQSFRYERAKQKYDAKFTAEFLINKATGGCLDVKDKSKDGGASLHVWPCQYNKDKESGLGDKSNGSQLWYVETDHRTGPRDGATRYVNVRSGKCMANSPSLGAHLSPCAETPAQWWRPRTSG